MRINSNPVEIPFSPNPLSFCSYCISLFQLNVCQKAKPTPWIYLARDKLAFDTFR